jgi:lysozyme
MNYKLIEMLKRHEGLRLKPYYCTAGKLTIGYGRNLEDVGISEHEAALLLSSDIVEVEQDIKSIFLNFNTFTENRQIALMNMLFNLGKTKFLKFKKMIKAIKNNDWDEASIQAKDSKWYTDVKGRAIEIIQLLKKG